MPFFGTGGGSVSTTTAQNPIASLGNTSTGAFFSNPQQPMQGSQDLLYGSQTIQASGSNLLVLGGALLAFALVMKGKL